MGSMRKQGKLVSSAAALGALGYYGGAWLSRFVGKKLINSGIHRLMVDPYDENLWELVTASMRISPQVIVENNLRAQTGKPLLRPLGSPRRFPNFDSIVFDFAMTSQFPTSEQVPVETRTVLGQKAAKPLVLNLPIIISGMAYGLALSAKARIALAKGATMAGTAVNPGEGPLLAQEEKAAKHLILQYHRGTWSKEPEVLRKANMIEIQIGQGALGATTHELKSEKITPTLRKALNLAPGQGAIIEARHKEIVQPEDFRTLVSYLREITGGVPIGFKIGASNSLEEDLEVIIDAGADFVALEGAEAGARSSAAILQDDFGIPTLVALCRAVRFLEKTGVRDTVSLIIGGGLFTPGHFLKALALGADAIHIGTAAIYAMSHTEVLKALPWEPPTQIAWYKGKFSRKLNENKAAKNLAKFLESCRLEMAAGVRALGKTSIHDLNREDLCVLDEQTAKITRLQLAY